MFRPMDLSRSSHSVRRVLFVLALLVVGLIANLSLIPSASADVQDPYAAPFDLWPGLTTAPLVQNDSATDVSSFMRDPIVETSTLGGCGNYPSDTSINTYSVWYTFTPPAGGGWLTLSTLKPGTNYDTVLDVWHDTVSSVTRVACNDDAVSGDRRSELSIPVVDTSTYYIAIRRYGSSTMPLPPDLSGSEKLAFYARFTTSPEIYVDQTNGSDANPGSITLPVRSIQKGVDLAPDGGIVMIAAGAYGENVVLNKSLTLIGTGNPTTTSFTLQSGVLGASSGGITAGIVLVQAGARVADGIVLAAADGSVTVDGLHTESVTIDKNLMLRSTTGATLDSAGTTLTVSNGAVVTIAGLNISGAPGLNNSGGTVTASANWWGDATGPNASTNPGGLGSAITGAAIYRPWCTVQAPMCTPVGGLATALAFNPSPNVNGSTVGTAFTQQPFVEARDSAGNVDTSFNGEVTLALAGGTPGATLYDTSGNTVIKLYATDGVAKFIGLYVDTVGTNYTLTATSNALTGTSGLFNIGQATQTITFSPPSVIGKEFGNPPFPVTASATSGLPVTITASGFCTYDSATNNVTITGAGSCTLDANQPGDANYLSATNQLIISIGKAAQTITFTPATIGTKNLSSGPIALTVSSNSSGALTYSGTSGVCTYDGAQVTITGVGTCVVTANQAADPNYIAGSNSLSFIVDKDAPTITFSPTTITTQTYGASPIALTVSSNSSGALTYSGTSGVCTYDGAQVTITGAGSCTVYANQVADATHSAATAPLSFTINKASATTTLANQSYTYTGAAQPAVFTTTPSSLAVNVTYTGSGGTSYPASQNAPTAVGSYAVHIVSTDSNYQITSGADATLTITRADQTITFDPLANKTYGDPTFALNATSTSGLPINFSATGNCGVASGNVTLTGAGSCTITASQPGDANRNAAADVSQMFTINKTPQSITFNPLRTRAVSNPSFTVSATATSGLPVSFSATGSCSVSGTTVALSGVGDCTITASQPGDANWGAAANVPQTFAIVTSFKTFIPVLIVPGYPDLVARFSLSTSAIAEHTPVIVTVTITNQGYAPADPFWVDFYVNPSVPPTAANQPWDKSCGRQRCEQGIAWYVDKRLAPGESITLTSTPNSYYAKNTVWEGSFNTGLLNLYLYADSWNPGVPTGAVYERNEANNRAEFHTPPALASAVARTAAPLPTDLPALPPRPARPELGK